MKFLNKKGFIDQIKAVVVGIAMIAIVIAVGFVILAQMKVQIVSTEGLAVGTVSNSSASNATNVMINALAQIPMWMPILILVAVGGLVIGAVMYFGRNKM